MMYELTVERQFSAAHSLRDYDGPCCRLHGHNYRVEVTVGGERLDERGMLMDFGQLKAICDRTIDRLDHRHLNELEPFATTNPTSENLARYLFESIAAAIESSAVRVLSVSVWEAPTSRATYRADGNTR